MANSKKDAPAIKQPAVAPATTDTTTVVNDAPKQDAPDQKGDSPDRKPIVEILQESKKGEQFDALRKAGYTDEEIGKGLNELYIVERNKQRSMEDEGKPFEEVDAQSMIAWKAKDQYKQWLNFIEAEKAQKETEAKLNEHLALADTFEKVITNILKATEDQLAEIHGNEGYKIARNKIVEELKVSFGKANKSVIHIPAGMTGKQLTKVSDGNGGEGKEEMYIRLLDSGMTKEQIMTQYPESKNAEGGPNGTLRTAITNRNKRIASTGK